MVATLQSEREKLGRSDRPMMIGHITPYLYVGKPDWDIGEGALSGTADDIASRILDDTADGVNQLQVRFKARSCDEMCDQIAAFATEVAPLLTKV